jgi:hypothetical protein
MGTAVEMKQTWILFNTTSLNVCVIAGFLRLTMYCRLATIHLNWVPRMWERKKILFFLRFSTKIHQKLGFQQNLWYKSLKKCHLVTTKFGGSATEHLSKYSGVLTPGARNGCQAGLLHDKPTYPNLDLVVTLHACLGPDLWSEEH